MDTLQTRVRPGSAQFKENQEAQLRLVDDLRRRLAVAAAGGSDTARDRHVSRSKLLPRDRIARLLDRGSPFLEIARLAANGMYNDETPAAGVIAGIGLVN